MRGAAATAGATARSLRLRPSVHYAPLDEGILFKSWDRSFTVEGHRALYGLFERLLPLLDQGVERGALLAAVPEHARAVVELLLDRLEEHGMCLDGPRRGPSAREAAAFAQTIAYLEGVAPDPAQAFARLRAARVAVEGSGAAQQAAIRALVSMGVGNLRCGTPVAHPLVAQAAGEVDLTIALDGVVDTGGTVLEGLVTDDVALVGPLRRGHGPGLADALERWRRPLARERPPAFVLAALLGNVAAFEAFRFLAGLPSPTAEGQVAAVSREGLRISHHPVVPRRPPALEARRTAPTRDEVVAEIRALSDEETGLIAPPHPGDLPQMPIFTCRSGNAIGWADDPTEAYVRAGVAALRAALPRPGMVLVAAPTHEEWLREGVLASLVPRLASGVTREIAFADLAGPAAYLWKTLRLRFGRQVAALHAVDPELPGAHLVAVLVDGETAGIGTGFTAAPALDAALREAVARAQLAEVGIALPDRPYVEPRPAEAAPWDTAGSVEGLGLRVIAEPWHGPRRALVVGWVGVDAA